jgi:tRNA(Ile)-lysidine synthase
VPDARTLVAVSGGADSTALLLALASSTKALVVGHVVHDMRSRDVAEGDRDAVRALASRLGVPFVDRLISGADSEGAARRLRLEALTDMATAHGCPFVVTGHHADDQFETIVMAICRGAGPDGMRGAAARRSLDDGVTLVRPMLGVSRQDARQLCRRSGVAWCEDATNLDTRFRRAALRHGPLARLTEIAPLAPERAARSARLMRDAAALVRERAEQVFGDGTTWPRDALRGEREVVLGAGLRRAAIGLLGGRASDRLRGRLLDPVVRAIRDDSTEPRRFKWPNGVVVVVEARAVRMCQEC